MPSEKASIMLSGSEVYWKNARGLSGKPEMKASGEEELKDACCSWNSIITAAARA